MFPFHPEFSWLWFRTRFTDKFLALIITSDKQLAVLIYVLAHPPELPTQQPLAMAPSKHTVVVGGLPVHVYSNGALQDLSGNVAVLFFLHGRGGSSGEIEPTVHDLFDALEERRAAGSEQASKQLVVATYVCRLVFLGSEPSIIYS